MKMLSAFLFSFLLAAFAGDGEFKENRLMLGLAFSAKALCTCVFATGQSENFCRDYASLDQINPKMTVDYANKKVATTFLWLFSREADFIGAAHGCVLK